VTPFRVGKIHSIQLPEGRFPLGSDTTLYLDHSCIEFHPSPRAYWPFRVALERNVAVVARSRVPFESCGFIHPPRSNRVRG